MATSNYSNRPTGFDYSQDKQTWGEFLTSDQTISTAIGGIAQGFDSYYAALAARRSYKAQQSNYESQAAIASLNAASTRASLANIGAKYEYEAMMKGLESAQNISGGRVQAASRGVKLNKGSTAEVEASRRIAARMDQLTINKNKTYALNDARMQAAQYEMQAVIAKGNARASSILSKVQNPWMSAVTGLIKGITSIDSDWTQKGYDSLSTQFMNMWSS